MKDCNKKKDSNFIPKVICCYGTQGPTGPEGSQVSEGPVGPQ